jgi:DNA-binding Lrp family transcriptional regulator
VPIEFNIYSMKLVKYFEFNQQDLEASKSFRVKDELNPKIWDDFKIDDEVRENLLKIAEDFYASTDLEADVEDIILTGSLANYNWSEKYSDYDLHILIDFTNVNDAVELVKKYVDSAKSIWNKEHDIKIKGYEVEVYIQDVSEPHKSTGVFSLLNNKWNVKPEEFDFEPDEDMIAEKGKSVMMMVDELEEQVDEDKYDAFMEKVQKVWEKVKNYRKSGLESEGGELSMGNLVFKFLRRNGYIGKIIELKRKSYDNQFK